MSKEILIQVKKGERQVAIIEHGRIEDFHIEVDRYQSLLGNIYKGRVESILPSINAAFVNIGQERNGFLYLTDVVNPIVEEDIGGPKKFFDKLFGKKNLNARPPEARIQETRPPEARPPETNPQEGKVLDAASSEVKPPEVKPPEVKPPEGKSPQGKAPGGKPFERNPQDNKRHHDRNNRRRQHKPKKEEIPFTVGQEILVQVVKDPFGEKGARLTTHVTLPGRFVVYMPFEQQTGVSRKIEDQTERLRLREVIKGFGFAKTGGFIIRTAALQQGKKELIRDAKFLHSIWMKISKKAEAEKAPALIYAEGELTWKIVRDYLTEDVGSLIIDSEEEFQKIRKFVHTLIGREMVGKIHHYSGPKPLFDAKLVSRELEKIYDTHIYVRSGAYVVIEPTEGLTVIDVNSGKFKTKASPGEAAFMVNMEVVPEIARQLRLRDIGGIIVVDFIDMVREDHKRKVLDAMQRALSRDYAKTEVYKLSPLGILEMTRARTGKNVESISFKKCPYCEGRGRVKFG